jgi:hypothetical protein
MGLLTGEEPFYSDLFRVHPCLVEKKRGTGCSCQKFACLLFAYFPRNLHTSETSLNQH